MRILVLATSYPTPDRIYQQAFIRARVRGYLDRGQSVSVLSFHTNKPYELDGVEIRPESHWRNEDLTQHFDVIVSHAPNLRQHLRFLFQQRKSLPPVAFTFHGHETLRIHRHYPPPYSWQQGRFFPLKRLLQDAYDSFKLRVLSHFIEALRRQNKVLLIYVSHAFRAMAQGDLRHSPGTWDDISVVIPNPIGVGFSTAKYHPENLLGDFLTIRPLDASKMAIDIVLECARQNPEQTFHLYGEGQILNHLSPPPNVIHVAKFLENDDIPTLLNRYRAAVMPSRCDAQGVMMCEMATAGIPVLASDIPAHREALAEFPRTQFLNNEEPQFDAKAFLEAMSSLPSTHSKVFHQETIILSEIESFEKLVHRSAH